MSKPLDEYSACSILLEKVCIHLLSGVYLIEAESICEKIVQNVRFTQSGVQDDIKANLNKCENVLYSEFGI